MKNDPRIWMWTEAVEMLEKAERIQRQFFRPTRPGSRRPAWEPPLDIYETDTDYVLVLALPGVPAESVQIGLEAGALVVSAERALPVPAATALIHRMEIPHGRFERRIDLPPGHLELGVRRMVDGCLVVQLIKY